MAVINIQYCIANDDIYEVSYDNVSHTIIAGTLTDLSFESCGDPKVDGDNLYSQTVSGGTYNVLAQPGSYPYARVVFSASGGCTANIVNLINTQKESFPGANDGEITATLFLPNDGTALFQLVPPNATAWQSSPVFGGLTAGVYGMRIMVSGGCTGNLQYTSVEVLGILNVDYEKTATSAPGGNDGTITTIVTNGSGNYTYAWDDGPTTANRTGLSAGSYSVTVTDTQNGQIARVENIVISDPLVIEVDPFFEIPQINPIRFVPNVVINNCEVFPTPDNELFCKSTHPYYNTLKYFQRVQQCDTLTVQFRSSVDNHTILLKNYISDTQIAAYAPVLKTQNIGVIETYSIYLTDNGDSRTRVYFAAGGPLPIAIDVDDAFEISANADGMDGAYLVKEVATDILLGTQYLIIETPYLGGGVQSDANGNFNATTREYNVYEFAVNFGAIPIGKYYFEVVASSNDGFSSEWISEPMDVQVFHKGTNMIEFTNFDNAFGVDYTTGIKHRIRVNSDFFKRTPGGSETKIRNTDGRSRILESKAFRLIVLELFELPPYLHELLAVAFRHDRVYINGVEFTSNGQYEEPEYIPRHGLSNSRIIVEQVGWFEDYNGNDLGGVDQTEAGFIIGNEGYIKR